MISTQVDNNLVEVVPGNPHRRIGSQPWTVLARKEEQKRQKEVQRQVAATAHDQVVRERVFANVARAHGLEVTKHPRTVEDSLSDDALEQINAALLGGISPEARRLMQSYANIPK